jgi:putative transposase
MGHHRCVVSDEAWAWLAPQLPSSAGRRGGRWRDHRQVIEAIAWKYRTGSPWRELPEQFGPWQTAYEQLTRWNADGTWGWPLARAQADADAAGELNWLVAVDSTAVRVHQHGAADRRQRCHRSGRPGGRRDRPTARGGRHRMTRKAAATLGRSSPTIMRSAAPAAD